MSTKRQNKSCCLLTNFISNQLGAVVGDLQVLDPDANDTHVFTVDDARFEVIDGSLKLRDDVLLPLGTSVEVMVTATDAGGLTYPQTFTVTAIPPGGGAGDNASISALQYAPGAALGQTFALNPSQCLGSSGLLPLPDPMTLSAGGLICARQRVFFAHQHTQV